MKIIGITGGIGSGKTTAAHFFEELGIPVYIADNEAKKLMHRHPIKKEIMVAFGKESYSPEGKLNRQYLSDQVFKNKTLLEKLNKIVHPRVEQHFTDWVKSQEKKGVPYILYEAAILFETGRYKEFDALILVTAPKKERIKRVLKRDQTTKEEIEARMNNQWPDEEKMKYSDYIIKNTDLKKTKRKISQIHELISNL